MMRGPKRIRGGLTMRKFMLFTVAVLLLVLPAAAALAADVTISPLNFRDCPQY